LLDSLRSPKRDPKRGSLRIPLLSSFRPASRLPFGLASRLPFRTARVPVFLPDCRRCIDIYWANGILSQ